MDSPYYISDVFAGLRGHPHFILAVKLSAQGQTYILRSTINFTAFNSLVENVQIGRTGTAFIVNAQGRLQTHPRSGTMEFVPEFIADPTIFKEKHTLILKHEMTKARPACMPWHFSNRGLAYGVPPGCRGCIKGYVEG